MLKRKAVMTLTLTLLIGLLSVIDLSASDKDCTCTPKTRTQDCGCTPKTRTQDCTCAPETKTQE